MLIDQAQIALVLCADSAVPQLVFSREQVWRSKLDICVQIKNFQIGNLKIMKRSE